MSEINVVPFGMKACPKCGVKNMAWRRVCVAAGCGFDWGRRKPRVAAAEAPPDVDLEGLPLLAVAPMPSGGLYLYWPRKGEHLVLSEEEAHLLRRAIGATPPFWSDPAGNVRAKGGE
jgi:hypothetical protein